MELTAIAKRLLIALVLIPLVLLCVVYDQGMLLATCLMAFVGMREFVLIRTQIVFPEEPPKDSQEHILPPRLNNLGDQMQMYTRCILAVFMCSSGYLSSPLLLPSSPVLDQGFVAFVYSLHSSFMFLTFATVVLLLLWVLSMFEILHAGQLSSSSRDSSNLRKEDFLAVVLDFCGIMYTGGALSFAMILTRINKAYMALVLMANWACDGMAMFCGKNFGHYKLNRKLSPNKTWEGALGAVLGASGAALISRTIFVVGQNYGLWDVGSIPGWTLFLWYGCVLGVLGIIGDLVKSYMKRIARIKDSGQFFGSHGGVLDRIDGLLFSFPLMYILLLTQSATQAL